MAKASSARPARAKRTLAAPAAGSVQRPAGRKSQRRGGATNKPSQLVAVKPTKSVAIPVAEFDEQRKKAFDYVQEATKQIITLSTGVLALTITFAHELERSESWESVLGWSWALYVSSIVAGVWVLLALSGTLEQTATQVPVSTRGRNVSIPALVQLGAFLLATSAIGAYAIFAPRKPTAVNSIDRLTAEVTTTRALLKEESERWKSDVAARYAANDKLANAIALGESVHVVLDIANAESFSASAKARNRFWDLYSGRLAVMENERMHATLQQIEELIADVEAQPSKFILCRKRIHGLAKELSKAGNN